MAMRIFMGFVVFCCVLAPGSPRGAECPSHRAPAGLARIADVMATGRFIGYVPTALRVVNGTTTPVTEADLEADLRILRPRFDGLITYSAHSGMERIGDVAARLGYRAVIMGIWDLDNVGERANVAAAAKRTPVVAGVSVGNEVVFGQRGTFEDLARTMRDVRRAAPDLAVTTTEPFHLLLEPRAASALREMDLLLANVHPVFEPWFRTAPDYNGAEFVVRVVANLAQAYCGPALVKETGVPTAPADKGFTAERQASFYKELQKQFPPSPVKAFAYFSAFDAPWRVNDAHPVPGYYPEEAHWGLYDHKRNPKPIVETLRVLSKR